MDSLLLQEVTLSRVGGGLRFIGTLYKVNEYTYQVKKLNGMGEPYGHINFTLNELVDYDLFTGHVILRKNG